jgi:membrane protease YdiL (CAAX protease family)
MYATTTTAPSAPSSSPSSLKGVLAHHPIISYFVLAYAGTWLTLAPVLLSRSGTLGFLPYSVPFGVFAVLFILGGLTGPTLAAFIMTAVTEGRPGVGRLARRYTLWRVGPQWYLLVLLGYVALNLLAASFALGLAPWLTMAHKLPLLLAPYLVSVLTFNLVTALGEEPGWRGFALPRLQRKYGPVGGSLVLGTFHALWHLPIFFIPALGSGRLTPALLMVWLPGVWATTITWTWIVNNAKGSLLIAILMHSAMDAAGGFTLFTVLAVGSLSKATQAVISYGNLGLLVGIALLLIVLTRGRLSYHRDAPEPRATMDPAPVAAAVR